MRCANLLLAVLLLTAAASTAAGPWFDLFLGQHGPEPSYASYPPRRRPSYSGGGGGRSGRDRFKSICRTINPDNYAFPGRVPYPSAPLCPY